VIREAVAQGGEKVLVTGAGAVLRQATRELLLHDCFTVHVDTPLALVIERLSAKTDRPLIAGADPVAAITRLYETRRGFYDFARLRVDGSDAKRAAEEIVARYRKAMESGTT
jgi:shikimate kinase